MKNNKLLKYFKTQEQFDAQRIYVKQGETEEEYIDQNGVTQWGDPDIYPEHICFIEDTKTIFTHNTKYVCLPSDSDNCKKTTISDILKFYNDTTKTFDESYINDNGDEILLSDENGYLLATDILLEMLNDEYVIADTLNEFDTRLKSVEVGDNLLQGTNISIDNNTISAVGYKYDSTKTSFATGYATQANGEFSFAAGRDSKANGQCASAIGENVTAEGQASHAEGNASQSFGDASHAEGTSSHAEGSSSHAEGFNTITTNLGEHAEGMYNKSNTGTISSIGIGTSDTDRKNAFEVLTDGNIYVNGIGDYDGTNAVSPNSEGKTAKTLQECVLNNKGETGNSILFYEDGITTDTDNKADVPTGFSVRVGDLVIDENYNLYKCIEE